ncbi:MAG: hypothetical protein ACI9QL_005453 [Candidatus Omnitrophota bacterium]
MEFSDFLLTVCCGPEGRGLNARRGHGLKAQPETVS